MPQDSYTDLEEKLARARRELSEALEQQTATSDILRIISSSLTDAQPVFDTIAKSAARLCKAQFCHVFRFDGELIHFAAEHGLSPEGVEAVRRAYPIPPGRASATARSILSGTVEHIPDVHADLNYTHGGPAIAVTFNSIVAVPMLKDGRPIGAISMARSQTGYFPEWQIKLLQSFADQAVIAIENARLFDEVQARTLQQQTATADVLKIITRSTFDLKTVLRTLVESAVRVCEADMGIISRPMEGDTYTVEASYGQSAALTEALSRAPLKIGRGSVTGRTALARGPVHILDAQTDPDYELHEALKVGDYHSMLGVPLLREGNLIGVFGLSRKTIRAVR